MILRLPHQYANTSTITAFWDENSMDIAHGLVGKTAIHPDQISVIEEALKVSPGEHSDALRILNSTLQSSNLRSDV